MLATNQQQYELVADVMKVEGIRRVSQPFLSAAGIGGNTKIELDEALRRAPRARKIIVGLMAQSLEGQKVITGVPAGGLYLAEEVAQVLEKPLVRITVEKQKGKKRFRLHGESKEIIEDLPDIGIVEDVTSTNSSILKIVTGMRIGSLITKGVSGWRKGVAAPFGMSDEEITEYNRLFPFKPALEFVLPFPMDTVLDLPMPLWIPTEKQQDRWLPQAADKPLSFQKSNP